MVRRSLPNSVTTGVRDTDVTHELICTLQQRHGYLIQRTVTTQRVRLTSLTAMRKFHGGSPWRRGLPAGTRCYCARWWKVRYPITLVFARRSERQRARLQCFLQRLQGGGGQLPVLV